MRRSGQYGGLIATVVGLVLGGCSGDTSSVVGPSREGDGNPKPSLAAVAPSSIDYKGDNFTGYTGTSQFLANTTLYSFTNSSLATIDPTVLYNGHQTLKSNMPSGTNSTFNFHVYLGSSSGTRKSLWLRVKLRFSPGFTLASGAYLPLTWPETIGYLRMASGAYKVYWQPTGSYQTSIGAGSIGTEFTDGAWYDWIVEYDRLSDSYARTRLWMARDGQAPVLRAVLIGTMRSAVTPVSGSVYVGGGFNATRSKSQAIWYGQWELVDGVAHPDPFNLGVAALEQIVPDVTYCTGGTVPLKLDIWTPKASFTKPWPVAVFYHGGGWQTGDKAVHNGEIPEQPTLTAFVNAGYAVASVNYRLAPTYQWPAQIQDSKCAIRFLRAAGSQYGLDPNRIGAYGHSAGGHLAALLGETTSAAGFDGTGGYSTYSSSVLAVGDLAGISDLTHSDELFFSGISSVFPTYPNPTDPTLIAASPVYQASTGDAPTMLIHSQLDSLVAFAQGQRLYNKLTSVAVPATLIEVFNSTHDFVSTGTGTVTPSVAQFDSSLVSFFDRYVKNAH